MFVLSPKWLEGNGGVWAGDRAPESRAGLGLALQPQRKGCEQRSLHWLAEGDSGARVGRPLLRPSVLLGRGVAGLTRV